MVYIFIYSINIKEANCDQMSSVLIFCSIAFLDINGLILTSGNSSGRSKIVSSLTILKNFRKNGELLSVLFDPIRMNFFLARVIETFNRCQSDICVPIRFNCRKDNDIFITSLELIYSMNFK